MTDNEIIKALECCTSEDLTSLNCGHCPNQQANCMHILYKSALDLINRQKAEIERLKGIINTDVVFVGRRQGKTQESNRLIRLRVAEIKSEAIKEFAEKLINWAYEGYSRRAIPECVFVSVEQINDLVKEMTEDN